MSQEATPIAFNRRGDGWHLHATRVWWYRGLSLVAAAIFLAVSINAWTEGKVVATLVLVAVGVAFAVAPYRHSSRRLPPRTVVDRGGPGLLLPVHPFSVAAIAAALVLGIVLGAGALVALDDAVATGALGQGVGAILGLVPAGLLLLGGYAGIRSRIAADRGVLLLPDVVVLRTRREPVRIPWAAVREVRAHWRRRVRGYPSPDEQISNWLTFEVARPDSDALALMSGSSSPSMDPTSFAVDADAALALIRFYLAHPDARAELGTDRALARYGELAVTTSA